ncbi:hypothetical protein K7B10_00970 [Streptomyces flavotricini]|uniref:Integral membrane protein n=1 Tax=Streptomyces flavotricini TaxID=66888 RepID=A0ABS8DX45_9ACTN|nr:hypothetical protein [Streptomyces flavotricini]MCC0093393.1 hypothetical protein [Streptomyces flavotricini]
MAADEAALEGVSAGTAAGGAAKTGRDARRIEGWSISWMLLAMVVWGCFAFLMLADYGPEVPSYQGSRSLCRGPFVDPSPQERVCRSDELRQWPSLLGILALAAVATVIAAATTVYAKALARLDHSEGTRAKPQG